MILNNKVLSLLEAIDEVFEKYKESNMFIYASMLYKLNTKLYNEILECKVDINVKKKVSLHFTLWFSEYEYHVGRKNPNLTDKFVFESLDSEYRFPRNLKELFELKKEE